MPYYVYLNGISTDFGDAEAKINLSIDLSNETSPETNEETRAIFPEEIFNDYSSGTTDKEDFSAGSSDDYVPETDEEEEADAESKAEKLDIVTTALEENPEIDQDMEGLIADVTNNEEVELKKPTRKRKVKSGLNALGYL